MNHAQQQDSAATGGPGENSAERNVVVALCALCLLVFVGSLIALAFWTHIGLGLISTSLVAWWLGSSLAETLDKTRKKSPPNTELGRAERRP